MVADEPAHEVRASALAGKMMQERMLQVESQLQQQEKLHKLEIQIMKRELAIQQSRYNKTRTGAQETQADHPQGSTSPQASTLQLSSHPRYETPQRYVAPPFGLDPSLPFGLENSLTQHEQHSTDPTNQMQQLVSVLRQFGGRDTDKVKITEFKDIDEIVTVSMVLCT